jgi:hypothetical protein
LYFWLKLKNCRYRRMKLQNDFNNERTRRKRILQIIFNNAGQASCRSLSSDILRQAGSAVLLCNPSAADHQIVLIKHRCLAGRDGALN